MSRADDYEKLREQHAQTVDELSRARRMLQLVMDTIPQAIFWKNRDSVFLGCNRAFARAAGLDSTDEIIGLNDYDLPWKTEESDFYRSVDQRVMNEDRPELHVIEPQLQASGKESWLDTNKVPLHGEDGDVIGILGTFEDITERRQAEQELERYRAHLEQLVEERTAQQLRLEKRMLRAQRLEGLGVLAAGVAHDFSNLLVGVIGNLDLALDELPTDEPNAALLRDALDAATRAGNLCRQMLACSGQGRIAVQDTDLDEILAELRPLLTSSIGKMIHLDIEMGGPLPPCEADQTQIRQMLLNLVINASEAIGDEPGRISIRAGITTCDAERLKRAYVAGSAEPGPFVHLEIVDDGCGMAPEVRDKIFDPFFTTKFTGRGLGLASVLGIVRAHGGLVEVDSEPSRGTCFRILLPVSRSADRATASRPNGLVEAPGRPLSGIRILLVDDEQAVRQLAARVLGRAGCQVVTAPDGLLAVETFERRHREIDCVILDLTMPRMGGIEAFGHMRTIRPELKVVLSTGYSVDILPDAMRYDALVRILNKPYHARDLVHSIGLLLGTVDRPGRRR
ncbi:MAG: ATP-binding protein [Acidobacteriota bacterium]